MRVKGFWFALISACLWLFASTASAQNFNGEHIARADITVRFDKDGSLKIREELDYVKPAGLTKRGIFKELPGKVREGAITYRKDYRMSLMTGSLDMMIWMKSAGICGANIGICLSKR